ncbi:MAG TPA: hypothetical protein VKV24_14700 [Casimicrobiaceae bacterium]|nr:hypothetical protein [Casimicrobiaceae bacterium]
MRIVAVLLSSIAAASTAAVDLSAQYSGTVPIYLFRDAAGKAYALELPAPGDSALARHYVTSQELTALASLGTTIAYLPEHPDASIGPCTSADFPRDFDIVFVEGVVFGNIAKCDPNGRPSGATVQSVEFVLFTQGYRAQAAHTAVMPWFKNALHGHGIYFGDTSAYPCASGADSTFNTRIEGWSQWRGFGPPVNPYWTSTGPLENQTCGTPMIDGWTPSSGLVDAAYSISVRSTINQWVRYKVDRWNGSAWIVHMPPTVRDMRYADWPNGPGAFDVSANGLLIGSTGPLGASSGSPWMIGIRDLSVEWSDGWNGTPKAAAVEFYDAGNDHYFMTADAKEISDLDNGVHVGWARTGYAFLVGTQGAITAEPVCRFYGLPSAGLDSHFYSANGGECDDLKDRFANAWLLESTDVFAVDLPDSVSGECPPHTMSVYRLWNGRKDSNHRYTTDPSVRQAMIARGYVAEGYGPQGVAMCAPAL